MSYVDFTPEEMAYDCPPDTSDKKKFPTIGPADKQWRKFINFRNGFAKLQPDLRKIFHSDKAVNDGLRELLRIKRSIDLLTKASKDRKSA